jgi:DNA-binding transcriptional regulator YiaG
VEIVRVRELVRSGKAKVIREQARVSRAEVARSVEVDPSTIARWEEGRRIPRGAAAIRYGEVLRELTELVS